MIDRTDAPKPSRESTLQDRTQGLVARASTLADLLDRTTYSISAKIFGPGPVDADPKRDRPGDSSVRADLDQLDEVLSYIQRTIEGLQRTDRALGPDAVGAAPATAWPDSTRPR